MKTSQTEKRGSKILVYVTDAIKNAVREECYRRSGPGKTFSESDLLFEMLQQKYSKTIPSPHSGLPSSGELPPAAEPGVVLESHSPFGPDPVDETKKVAKQDAIAHRPKRIRRKD